MVSFFWLVVSPCFGAPADIDSEHHRAGILSTYDLPVETMVVREDVVGPDTYLAELMVDHGVLPEEVPTVVAAAEGVFDVRRIHEGRPLLSFRHPDRTRPSYLVYEETERDFVVFDLTEPVRVTRGQKMVQRREVTVSGTIETSLYDALRAQNSPPTLVRALVEIFDNRIDFRRFRPGDRFRIIYEQELAGAEVIGVGKIKAAWIRHGDDESYAFLYDRPHETLYLDEHGIGVRTGFLRAPIKGGRVSSNYTGRRFHPVQKRYKPHLGTDYAAPVGTPILAMADGTVSEAEYSRHNGHYVKIRHDAVHETQYLHMVRIAEHIAPGTEVHRGQVIGYVGETGLAVGPHVCLRFWKNGRQVDFRNHRQHDTEVGKMLSEAQLRNYLAPLRQRLDGLAQPVAAQQAVAE